MNLRSCLVLAVLVVAAGFLPAQETLVSQEGELSLRDSRYEDGRPVDWYDVTVPRGRRLVAQAVSADFTPTLVIDGPAGVIEYDGNRFGAEAAAQYLSRQRIRIGVMTIPDDAGTEGAYSLRVRLHDSGPTLRAGSTVEGRLDRNDEHLADQRAIDWYSLEIRRGQRLYVGMDSVSLDTYLVARYPDGTERFNDDFVDANAGMHLTAGEDMLLQLGATTFGQNSYGDYQLVVEESAPPREIRVGQTISGTIDESDGGMDLYSLSGTTGQMVIVEANSNEFDTFLLLRELGGFFVENDDMDPGVTDSRLMYTFSSDDPVEIEVSAFGGGEAGRYQLSVNEFIVDEDIDEVVDGQLLHGGDELTAILGEGEQRFAIRALANHRVSVSMSSDFFDTYLTLVGPSGQEFSDDDGLGGTDSFLEIVAPETGTYELYASSYSGTGGGLYTISYREGGEVRLLACFEGVLDSTAPRDSEGLLFRRHSFDGRAGQYVTIDLKSSAFDTYLVLEGPEGYVIAENDDYGPGTDSRISVELEQTGRYTVVASGYWEDSEGPYEVVVSE